MSKGSEIPPWVIFAGSAVASAVGMVGYELLTGKLSLGESAEVKSARAAAKQEARVMLHKLLEIERPITGPERKYPTVTPLNRLEQKRILITGGAGFVGSHLVDALMAQGHLVYVLDNLFTGHRKNIQHWFGHPNFQFFQHDVTQPFFLEADEVFHLACPASPPHYKRNPIKTIKCSTLGTSNMLGLAKRCKAKLLFTSTSEIYGDPLEHPQRETYWGNVNTMGPRSCYDEGKRVAETMCYCYREEGHVDVRISRIFNTYGPRMDPNDGRVVSNFIIQALQGKDITIYGDGTQTRSFQYVQDLVRGLLALMASKESNPVNIGNPTERTINDFAEIIVGTIPGTGSRITHVEASADDPKQRKPDISRAWKLLGWRPAIALESGLKPTIEYFKDELGLRPEGEAPHASSTWLPLPLRVPTLEHPDPEVGEAGVGAVHEARGGAAGGGGAAH